MSLDPAIIEARQIASSPDDYDERTVRLARCLCVLLGTVEMVALGDVGDGRTYSLEVLASLGEPHPYQSGVPEAATEKTP